MKNPHSEIKGNQGDINQDLDKIEENGLIMPSAEKDDFFRLLADNARDLIFHMKIKPVSKFDYVSPSSTDITGYTPEEFYADPTLARKCIPPEDFRLVSGLEYWSDPNNNKPVEVRWRCKDGRMIWTEHMISVTRDKEGNPESFLIIARDVTERKQAEAALLETQQFNTSLLEHAPHATVVINPDTSVKYVNPAWERINGWTLSEAVGLKVPYPWWPTQFIDTFSENFKKAMQQNSGKGEVIAQKKNGEIYWIDMNWVIVTNNGDLQYLIINSVDITERKRMETALKESEEKFSTTFSASPNPVCVVTAREGTFLEVNESFLRFTGYPREEVIGRTPVELNLWVNQEDIERMARPLKETGRLNNEEIQSRMKSGEIRTGLFSAETIEIGGKKCMILVITDITEQVKVEEALRESEEKFSVAFRASPQMMTISDSKTGKFIDVNDSYVDNTGYSREEFIGHTGNEKDMWVNPEEQKRMARLMQEQGEIRNEEFSLRMKSGEIRNWLCSADVINIGGESCSIAVAVDITERKRMEKALVDEATRRRILIEQSRDGIVILDQDGKVEEANQRFADLLRYSLEEVRELHVFDWEFLYPHEQVLKMIRTVDETGDHFETQHRRKDGTIYDVEISTNGAMVAGQKLIFCVCRDITERKRMEKALKESEEKFSRAFHASPDAMSISKIKGGTFLEVNDSFVQITGYTREEVISQNADIHNMWAKPEQREMMLRNMEQRQKMRNELFDFRTKSGKIRTLLLSTEYINIGDEPCVLTVSTDITQQKLAEEQLRLLSSVTQQVSDSTVITDPDFNITYMNRAAEDMFGYTLDEVRGKSLSIFNKTPLSEETKEAIHKTLAAGKVYSATVTKQRKDGNTIICDSRLSPLYDGKGNIFSLIDVHRNITKQKEIEAKLQEHKKLIDSILATMPEGVLVIDGKDHILLANKAMDRIFHFNANMLKDASLKEIFPVDQFFDLHKAVKYGETGKNSLEFRYKAQGFEKIIYCILVKMYGERTLLTFSDVSREREEEEKLYLTDRLASIGEMAAGLAHELNNPLTGILALSALLTKGDLPQDCKEDIECINSEAKRAADIVKNVLLFARNKIGDTGQSSVNEAVKNVIRLREYEQRTSNINVVTNLEENLPDIPIDKGQLQQVFLNLISNAEAAIKELNRPGVITVATQRVNGHINILFSDNGCGIKKQIMPRIFDPFFTTKEIGKGTGLGLSICYSIIVKHGGKIGVKSQVNEGTTFTIRMPVAA